LFNYAPFIIILRQSAFKAEETSLTFGTIEPVKYQTNMRSYILILYPVLTLCNVLVVCNGPAEHTAFSV